MFREIFKRYPAKMVFGEMGKYLLGHYLDWKKIVKWTFRTQIAILCLSIWIIISFGLMHLIGDLISQDTNSNDLWNQLSQIQIFMGKYENFINQSSINQDTLIKFAGYVFLNKTAMIAIFLIYVTYIFKFIICYSILSRCPKEKVNLMAFDIFLNPFPIGSYKKIKKMNLPNNERQINFSQILNDLLNLQNFPTIQKNKELVRSTNLSFGYNQKNQLMKWIEKIVEKYWPNAYNKYKFSKCINRNKQSEEQQVLNNLNLSIKSSSFTSILGCNGSSKSTMLKAIINLFEDYSGEILWIGKNLKKISHKSFYKNVAYIAQETMIQNSMSVYDYVACGLFPSFAFFKFSYPKDDPTILENLKKTGILKYRDKNINNLSGGEKQKAILARVLTQKTKIIILDEPTTYLDVKNQYLILDILKKLQVEENKTIITILHDIEQAEQFSDEVILLDKGRIYAYGKTKDVINKQNIEKVFGIPWD